MKWIWCACLLTGLFAKNAFAWSEKAATDYLDSRAAWWMNWPPAARDHGTFCISCHTAAPYALARPASAQEGKLRDNVVKRVRQWKEVDPFYSDKERGVPKTAESRGTEAILNALILSNYAAGAGHLDADGKLALDNLWPLQLKTGDAKGAWSWLQFHNAPWEGDSQFYGATLAAIAIGTAPDGYRTSPEIQDGLKLLREYLVRENESQVLIDRVVLLWASAKIPGLLNGAQRQSIVNAALPKQQADGGFSLSSFVGAWKRHDNTPLDNKSDGYATGLVAFALEQADLPGTRPQLERALSWLRENQEASDGRWLAYSLNKQRDLSSDVGRFMSDAATAYAVLALKGAK